MSRPWPAQLSLFEAFPPTSIGGKTSTLFRGSSPAVGLQVCVLGSGSSGNATLVRLKDAAMLIDAGFGPRTTARRMDQTGLTLDDIDSVCVTHLDRDHFNPNWITTLLQKRIKVYVHSRHSQSLRRLGGAEMLHRAGLLQLVNGESFEPLSGLVARTIHLPHDSKGTTGFLMESEAGRIGYATDLGRVSEDLVQMFAGVDLLAIESNYDPVMQQASPRPPVLKRRITGGYGHLSNQQAFEAVGRIFDESTNGGPGHVVLLHRSRQCNCPVLLRRLFEGDRRLASRLMLTEQSEATGWLTVQL